MRARSAKRDANGIAVYFDPDADKLADLISWRPSGGAQCELVRLLKETEREALDARAAALELGLQPYADARAVELSLLAMFAGFRSMRQQGENAEDAVHVTMVALREFPAWAIEHGCQKITRGETKLDERYPPNDVQIHAVIADVVRPYRNRMRVANELLNAKGRA